MNASLHAPIAPRKRFAAVVCLMAVFLLWSPLWAAALQASGMDCCDGTMCAAHGHSPMSHVGGASTPAHSGRPMQCDHSSSGSMMQCAMSCCHEQPRSFTASIQFVLPLPPAVLIPVRSLEAISRFELTQVLYSFDPLSPPPRNSFLSLQFSRTF